MEYSLTMVFVNEAGDKASITFANIKPNITEAEVSAAMDVIIAKNIFFSSGGDLKTKYSAQLTERNVTKYALA
jgi:Protein of unknown function (DUF2922).